jgi:protein involved in polysaccharide export with SLBB domain
LKLQTHKRLLQLALIGLVLLIASGNVRAQRGGADSISSYDRPINPDQFMIRPGEELTVTFLKTNLPQLILRVSAEGRISQASIGSFDLRGKTLTQARTILYEPLTRQYNTKEIDISVSHPVPISILVVGRVRYPGMYRAYTSERVSTLLQRAGGVVQTGTTRAIILDGGPVPLPVDLDAAIYLSQENADPYLYAGSRITVLPRLASRVQVVGEVENPREVELKESDKLQDLIGLAGGVRKSGDSLHVRLLGRPAGETQVRAGDIIQVPRLEESRDEMRISLFGEITNPGRITYVEGITLTQAIQQAGGPTARSNMDRVTVFRRLDRDPWGHQDDTRYPILAPAPETETFRTLVLRPSDSIMIPIRVGYIRVSGLVRNPGLQPFTAGKDAQYYINAAGGYLPVANKSEILLFDRISRLTLTTGPAAAVADGDEVIVKQLEKLP